MKTAESVPFTLVEGCGAFTQKETARFVEMSIKSTKERFLETMTRERVMRRHGNATHHAGLKH
jgi:hypothetical protein